MLIATEYDFTDWKEKFIQFTVANGNQVSTAKDYASRIERILKEESLTAEVLFCEIDRWIEEYETGKNASVNKTRHSAPLSALKRFREFAPTLCKPYAPKAPDLTDVLTGKVPTDLIY